MQLANVWEARGDKRRASEWLTRVSAQAPHDGVLQ